MPLGANVSIAGKFDGQILSSQITHKCIVTPHARRSLTRSTLLIMSLPRSSKMRIFHIGSPSELRIGVACGMRPFELMVSLIVEDSGAT